jgi:hypothetical protein
MGLSMNREVLNSFGAKKASWRYAKLERFEKEIST